MRTRTFERCATNLWRMTQQGPGWYPDPSGLPATFRWWDGQRWTEDITTDPGSGPAAGGSAPVGPPSRLGEVPPRPPGAVPPPPGAPGPGYIPPALRRDASSAHPLEVLTSGDGDEENGRRRRLTGLIVVLGIVAILVGGGVYLAYVRDGDPSASPTPSAGAEEERPGREDPSTPSDAPFDPTDPEATPPVEGGGPAEITPTPEKPFEGARLEFDQLPRPWTPDSQSATMFRGGTAQTQVTEERYDGEHSWVAMVAAGVSNPEWYERRDLPGSAEEIATWFANSGFNEAEVDQTTRSGKPLTVDGRPGYLLQKHFTYQIDGLKSQGEAIWVVVVDLGSKKAGGVFVASIPDTDAKLSSDVDKAISSLQIVD